MKKIYALLLVAFFASSCKEDENDKACAPMVCTENFVSIPIKFVDKDGKGIDVIDFKVINSRTGENIEKSNPSPTGQKGTYIVIDDLSVSKVSEDGDLLNVSAKNPINNVQKQVSIKVKGGKCSCHIEKISGPEQVIMEQ